MHRKQFLLLERFNDWKVALVIYSAEARRFVRASMTAKSERIRSLMSRIRRYDSLQKLA